MTHIDTIGLDQPRTISTPALSEANAFALRAGGLYLVIAVAVFALLPFSMIQSAIMALVPASMVIIPMLVARHKVKQSYGSRTKLIPQSMHLRPLAPLA